MEINLVFQPVFRHLLLLPNALVLTQMMESVLMQEYFGVDGKTNSSTYYGSFTVEFNAVTAAGSDYTNAIALTSDSVTFTPADDEFVWYSFTPEVSGNYMLTNTPSAAAISSSDGAGATVAAISINDGVASFVGAADFNAYTSAKSVIKAMEAGTTYYICVVGRGKDGGGGFSALRSGFHIILGAGRRKGESRDDKGDPDDIFHDFHLIKG